MAKKRSRQQSSNGIVTAESTESDSSTKNNVATNTKTVCTHVIKSVDQNQVRRNLLKNLEDNFCQQCSKKGKPVENDEICVCLKCGAKSCSFQHSKDHFAVPRSDSHCLALNLTNLSVWCHGCNEQVDVSFNKKLKVCVNNVDNMYERYLKGPVIHQKATPKIETVAEENGENKLAVIPLENSKSRSPGTPGVRGLWNLGNTCFFNSVLQCLAQTPSLIDVLKQMEPAKEVSINLKSGKKLTGNIEKWDALCETLADTLINIRSGGSTLTPSKLLNLLRKKVPQFLGNDQHDAHELLRNLLDSVRSADLKRYRRIMLTTLGLKGVENDKVDCEKQNELKQMDRDVTEKVMLVPDQVFRGFLVSRLECQECHHSSECVESFSDLSLPVTCEKPHPPSVLRKSCGGSAEEKGNKQLSKHQLKKERKLARKKNKKNYLTHNKKNMGQGDLVPSISEKGESDADGDIDDSEPDNSDIKTDKFLASQYTEEMLCAGVPVPTNLMLQERCRQVPPLTRTHHFEGIQLLDDGTPNISKLHISDSSQPCLKMHVRDSKTLVKEEPSWHSQLFEFPDPTLFPQLNDLANDVNNKTSEGVDESQEEVLNGREDQEKSSGGKAIDNNSSCDVKNDVLNDDKSVAPSEWCDDDASQSSNDQKSDTVGCCGIVYVEAKDAISDNDEDEASDNNSSSDVKNDVLNYDVPAAPSVWCDDDASQSTNDQKSDTVGCHGIVYVEVKDASEVKDAVSDNDEDEPMMGSLFDDNSCGDLTVGDECSIQTCLSQFTGIEMMTGSNKVGCESCTAKANNGNKDGKTVYTLSTKQLLISEAPPVLILHIKRFHVQMQSFRKLNRHVAFPLKLDISSFCKAENIKNASIKPVYSLYGIVEHSGNYDSGHYVAYVNVEDGRWYCISDSYVNEVKESRVLQAQAYLLFYKILS